MGCQLDCLQMNGVRNHVDTYLVNDTYFKQIKLKESAVTEMSVCPSVIVVPCGDNTISPAHA